MAGEPLTDKQREQKQERISQFRTAQRELRAALKDKTDGILTRVRCVLANYGPLLGLTVADAEAVIERHRAKKTA